MNPDDGYMDILCSIFYCLFLFCKFEIISKVPGFKNDRLKFRTVDQIKRLIDT